jgi:hypothetical protein
MTTLTDETLREIARRVFRERSTTLAEAGAGREIGEYTSDLREVRRAMRQALRAASESAFGAQESGEGEAAWSAGQVVAHVANAQANMSAAIGALAEALVADGERRDLDSLSTRDEALAILDEADRGLEALLAAIPADADLARRAEHERFGEMSIQGWLLLMVIHERDHVRQIRALG